MDELKILTLPSLLLALFCLGVVYLPNQVFDLFLLGSATTQIIREIFGIISFVSFVIVGVELLIYACGLLYGWWNYADFSPKNWGK